MTNPDTVWTEGVCGDGAAILRDGIMVPIEEIVSELNRLTALTAESERKFPTDERLLKTAAFVLGYEKIDEKSKHLETDAEELVQFAHTVIRDWELGND